MADFDLVVRGGTVADGLGGTPFEADVAITGGKIAAIGPSLGSGREEIDARGMLVTPGFVDIHTHYDGQVTWEDRLSPSSDHGVTTVVTGSCGVGFAPCRPADHEDLVSLMAGVEDIPEVVMTEGLPWTWESFPEYLDTIAARPHDVDIATLVPHSAVRVFAMGERAIRREDATPDDIEAMGDIVREAVAAGAVGFATSRALQHKSLKGESIPTVRAAEDELRGILGAMPEGVFQLLSDFDLFEDVEGEFAMFRRLVGETGRPLSFTVNQKHRDPDGWRQLMDLVERASDDGLPIRAQVLGRPTGLLLGFEVSRSPFSGCPTYDRIFDLPFDERIAELAKPDVRAAILVEAPEADRRATWDYRFEMRDEPDYEPMAEESLAARAAEVGVTPAELAYDILLKDGGRRMIFEPAQNFYGSSLDAPYEMITHKDALLGLGDGGAHYGLICDASYPTTMLAYWSRDRVRGPKMPVEDVVRKLTSVNADAFGFHDRGRLAPGYKADLNVIDYDKVRLHAPEVVYDLPSGGKRIVQRADGYKATIVGGEVTYRDGVPTGALPGKLIRGVQQLSAADPVAA